jgi:protoporphyrinogen oxidase
MKKIAVIGGGFTGMAAATSLRNKGYEVHLFEKQNILGGLAAGFKEPHWNSSLEYFYHHWFKSDTYVQKYAELWNCSDGLVFKRPTTVIETDYSGFVRLDSAISLLQYPELPFHEKIRLGSALAYLKVTRDWKKLEKHRAEEWCTKYMGSRPYQKIWQPLMVGKFGEQHSKQVNMAWLWSRLSCRTPELGTFIGGFQLFINRAEEAMINLGVRVHKGISELQAQPEDGKWQIFCTGRENDTFDGVVVTASPTAFEKVIGGSAPSYLQQLKKGTSLGVQVIVLANKKRLGQNYWYSLKRNQYNPYLALIEHTNFVSESEYSGEHLVYLAKYVDTQSAEWVESDEQLVSSALKTCQRVNPNFDAGYNIRSYVFRDGYAQPIMGPNASQVLPPIKVPDQPNLFHASMSHVYPWDRGTNFALELGERATSVIFQECK